MTNELGSMLEKVLPQYKKVSEAPPLAILDKMSTFEINKHYHVMFKAIDSLGNIYLVQNPNLMSWQMLHGISPVKCIKPRLVSKEEMRSYEQPRTQEKTDLVKADNTKIKQLRLGE